MKQCCDYVHVQAFLMKQTLLNLQIQLQLQMILKFTSRKSTEKAKPFSAQIIDIKTLKPANFCRYHRFPK